MRIRVIPGRVALLLVAVAAAAGLAALILNVPLALVAQLTAVAVIVLITVAVGDFFATRLAWRKSNVQMIRKLPPAFAVGVSKPVRVLVRTEGALVWRCKLYDHSDPSFITDGMPKSIELAGGNVRGAAMHIAARIADLAEPGQVYASWATRELLAGSPIGFTDRGLRELKGLSEERRVYLVDPSG